MTVSLTQFSLAAGGLAALATISHYGVKLIKWAYHKARAFDNVMSFVPDIATNHLPHVYHAQVQQGRVLVQIANKLGVEAVIDENDPPPIRFVADKEAQ